MSGNPKYRKSYSVFVSGRFASRERCCAFAARLCEEEGVLCSLRWFDYEKDDDQLSEGEKLVLATKVVNAVRECDYFVHLHDHMPQRGGNLTELGVALAFGKTIIAVVPDGRGIFHELPQVFNVHDDETALTTVWDWVRRKVGVTPASRGVHVQPVPERPQVEPDALPLGAITILNPLVPDPMGQYPVDNHGRPLKNKSHDPLFASAEVRQQAMNKRVTPTRSKGRGV